MKKIKVGISHLLGSVTHIGSDTYFKRIKLVDIKEFLQDIQLTGKTK